MKIALFRYVAERVTTLHLVTMIAAVLHGAPPRQISDDDYLKNSLPAVPLKKALRGVLSYPDNFLVHGDRTESNPICFLQIMNSILLYG